VQHATPALQVRLTCYKARSLQTLSDPLAQVLDRRYHASQFLLAILPRLYLALLTLHHFHPLGQLCLATALLVQLQHASQIRLGEPLQLLRQTPGRFLQSGVSGLKCLRPPGAAASSPQRRFDLGRMAQQFTDILPDILPDHLVELRRRNVAGGAALISAGLGR
jgi:hypothetical protein